MVTGTSKEQSQTKVRFRGLIATSRVIRRDGLVTLLSIGVANAHYIDVVYPDIDYSSLFSYAAVEGIGMYEKKGGMEMIVVEKIHGVSLQVLAKQDKLPFSSGSNS
jgi:hypothetical protein